MLRPTFLGFETQKRALFSAQKALDITGSNIGNVDTEGYTRQRVDLFSVENFQGGLRYNTKVALAGQGVDMRGVTQIRDVLLDERYRTLSGEANESTTKADILYQVEDVIDDIEAAETGFSGVMSKFEAALQSFSADNADRREMAAIAINEAKKVGQIFQNFSSRIDQVSNLTLTKTENAVKRINEIFKQISALNKQIVDDYVASNETYIGDDGVYKSNTTYGPLELKDQRNVLLDELAEYGNVYVKENPLGDITVSFGDQVMVDRVYYDIDGNKVELVDGKVPAGVKAIAQNVFGKLSLYDPSSTNASEKAPSNLKLYASELYTAEEWVDILSDPDKADSVLGIAIDDEGVPQYADGANTIGKNEILMIGTDGRTTSGLGLTTGTLKGLFDMYNGNGDFVASTKYTGECKNGYQGIPYFKEVINSLAKTMADKFNAANGYDGTVETDCRKMFTYDENDAAFTFAVTDYWKDDTMMVVYHPEEVTVQKTKGMADFLNSSIDKISETSAELKKIYENDQKLSDEIAELNTKISAETHPDKLKVLKAKKEALSINKANLEEQRDAVIQQQTDIVTKMGEIATINTTTDPDTGGIDLLSVRGVDVFKVDSVTNVHKKGIVNVEVKEKYTDGKFSGYTTSAKITGVGGTSLSDELIAVLDGFTAAKLQNDVDMITKKNVGEELDNESLHRLLAVFQGEFTYDSIPSGQKFTLEGYVRNYGEIIGEKTEFEYDSAKSSTTILESVGAARDEIMGVSLDEEGINMMNFQKWYSAAARMMTTLDEALNVIINQMGLVGRG